MSDMATNLIGAVVRFTDVAARSRPNVTVGELARIRAVWVTSDDDASWAVFLLETADGRLVQFPEGPYVTIYPARNEPGPPPPDPGDRWGVLE